MHWREVRISRVTLIGASVFALVDIHVDEGFEEDIVAPLVV